MPVALQKGGDVHVAHVGCVAPGRRAYSEGILVLCIRPSLGIKSRKSKHIVIEEDVCDHVVQLFI